MGFEINHLIIADVDPFGLKAFLHGGWCGKMQTASQNTVPIHNAMCRYWKDIGLNIKRAIHRPPHHSTGSDCPQVAGNGSIARDATPRNQSGNVMDIPFKISASRSV